MKHTHLLLALLLGTGTTWSTVVVQDDFTYSNGDVDTVGTGGIGWASQWANGNSNATRRFVVTSGVALYQGGGNGTQTAQNRQFSSSITIGLTDTVTLAFTLIRPEGQAGRGIGIYLTNSGANQLFIGKEINDNVGLKSGMNSNSTDHAEFSSSGTSEAITATITFDGVNTSIVMADSNETLAPYSFAGAFTFDGISLAGYHQSTTSNGIDDISIDVIPEPATALLGALGLLTLLRRRR